MAVILTAEEIESVYTYELPKLIYRYGLKLKREKVGPRIYYNVYGDDDKMLVFFHVLNRSGQDPEWGTGFPYGLFEEPERAKRAIPIAAAVTDGLRRRAQALDALAELEQHKDSGHYHYPPDERKNIVKHYYRDRADGKANNKEIWAQNNYGFTGKTLKSYQDEFKNEILEP